MYKLLSETTCRQHMKWSPLSYPFTHTPSLTPNAHTHSHLHSALSLSSTSNSWSYNNFLTSMHSGSVQSSTLYTALVCNSLINTHNLSQTQSEVSGRRGWWNSWLLPHSLSHCQPHPANHPHSSFTLTFQLSHSLQNLSITPHTPHLSQWHSVQFKFIVTSMSSTGDVRG